MSQMVNRHCCLEGFKTITEKTRETPADVPGELWISLEMPLGKEERVLICGNDHRSDALLPEGIT